MKRVYQRVILIDDEAIQNKVHTTLIQRYFGSHHIEIVTFTNPVKALQYLENEDAGQVSTLILLDLKMPSMDGWEFLNRLHLADPANTAIYILSSSISQADVERAGSHPKVAGYTRKPLSSAINGLLVGTLAALENSTAGG